MPLFKSTGVGEKAEFVVGMVSSLRARVTSQLKDALGPVTGKIATRPPVLKSAANPMTQCGGQCDLGCRVV